VRARALAPGKVNLCLLLGGTRPDGRHELVTLFESLSLADELTLQTQAGGADEVICAGVEGPNLVGAAIAGLRARGWDGPPVRIEVRKRIPVAAGMGGGSADAACALRLAAAVAPLPAAAVLSELAAMLGADVPSQLEPGLALGTGAGEVVEPVAPTAPHTLVIVPLPAALSTPAVYAEADRLGLARPAEQLRDGLGLLRAALAAGARPPEALLRNDLEAAARALCPEIDRATAAVSALGADHVFVSGSGPTVAGLFWEDGSARASEAAATLARSYPGAVAAAPVGAAFGAVETLS
jgi:4-diphosphocytidyl-2-C-methyl-D-erythritol kinase